MTALCTSQVRIPDDKWGATIDFCRLDTGHPGPHRSPRKLCVPVAWLVWDDTHEHPDPAEEETP